MVKRCLRGVWGLVVWLFTDTPGNSSPRHYQVIEIEKGVPTSGDDDAIATLRDHPGFIALMNRMKLKRGFLRSQLENTRHESLRDVDILVTGLAWLRYLEFEVNAAVGKLKKASPIASLDEVEEFEKIRLAIESVGSQDQM